MRRIGSAMRGPHCGRRPLAGMLLALLVAVPTAAGAATTQLDAADYARAQRFLPGALNALIDGRVQGETWLPNGRLLYAVSAADGDRYRVVDAATGKVLPAFDRSALATALAKASGKPLQPETLAFFKLSLGDGGELDVRIRGGRYRCRDVGAPLPDFSGNGNTNAASCTRWSEPEPPAAGPQVGRATTSPDGKWAVFERDWNLWLRDLQSGQERPLTSDGVPDYGYATGNNGWIHDVGAIVRWSPDSTRVATFRQDQRKVGNMYLLRSGVGHPELEQWKYALPGDEHVFMIEPLVIDIHSGKQVRLQLPPQQRISSRCDRLACDDGHPNRWSDAQWAADGRSLALVNAARDRQQVWLRIADADSGAVRTIFDERVPTYFESGIDGTNWRYLPESGEALWYSERNGWGNLYLYDLKTGKPKRAVTGGAGNVLQISRLERDQRRLWFVGNARTSGLNPYFKQFFSADIDSGKTTLLTPEPADHKVELSPDGRYFVDTYSTVAQAPVTVLRDASDGRVIATLGRVDTTRLTASGWAPPELIEVTARDGKTPLYGLLFKPSHFDPTKKYPVVDYIYPGPQTGSVRSFAWTTAHSDHQALAELGFVVVALNGMGTPWRGKAFQDASYGDMGDNTLPDQIAAIRQLAARHPWIDLDRVGIWGHSGGGYASAAALLRYPDFFKVGWAESGNHDNRNYENDWGEKYHGLLRRNPDGSSNYDRQANQALAGNLKGQLMLVHGLVDGNVPVSSTLLLVKALTQANKDFDLLLLPTAGHGFLSDRLYVMRRRWDYFVRHLQGVQPPKEVPMGPMAEE